MNVYPEKNSNMSLLSLALFALVGYFAPWGSGMQNMSTFDISKVFVGACVVFIAYWLISEKAAIEMPAALKYFLIFAFVHTVIVYAVFFRDEFTFSYTGEAIMQDGFVRTEESQGLMVMRSFLFMLFGVALINTIKSRAQLITLSLAYGLGLVTTIIVGGFSAQYGLIDYRISAGFLDPNAFGLAGLTGLFLALMHILDPDVKIWLRYLFAVIAVFAVAALFLSGSRGAWLAALVGIIVTALFSRGLSNKLKVVIAILIFMTIGFRYLPQDIVDTLLGRASVQLIQEDQGAGRLYIWDDYIHALPGYWLTGTGIHRSMEAIRYAYSWKLAETHNNYLGVLIEFGVIGLLLFLFALFDIWRWIKRKAELNLHNTDYPVKLGMFTAWLISGVFLDNFSSRETWIILGVILSGI